VYVIAGLKLSKNCVKIAKNKRTRLELPEFLFYRPPNPIEFLAAYLLKNKTQFDQ